MIFFAKPLLDALRGIDPLIFLAPICLGLSPCFMALLVDLEKGRARRRKSAARRKSLALASRTTPDLRRDRHN